MGRTDAVVVGAGPNGLAAAVRLAQTGRAVTLFEARERVGGGTRSAELTLPGFVHDVCSAIHPLGVASPFLRTLPLDEHGLRWVQPPIPLAHPFDDGTAAALHRSVACTAATLGPDAAAYSRLMTPLVDDAERLLPPLLAPIRPPRHPLTVARFALDGLDTAERFVKRHFAGRNARALFAGTAAHAFLGLHQPPSAAFGLLLVLLGHTAGWPIAQGGSQAIADAMAGLFRSLGGEIVLGARVRSLDRLPTARAYLFDTDPAQLAAVAGDRLSGRFRQRLQSHPYTMAVFKVDWALDGPIPWRVAECRDAGTVHVGGTLEEIAEAERLVTVGGHPERPFVLLAQQSRFDPSRAPAGKETGWAYCHVPLGSTIDMTERIEAQVERFAPGFRDRILARSAWSPLDFERWNPNDVGGAVNGGAQDLPALLRQTLAWPSPYATPHRRLFLCSSSTPPGGGVHGMCGFHAAQAAIHRALA